MLEQYTYEPYGSLIAAEMFHPHAMNRAGHQGLFFERFDGSYDDYTLFRVAQGTAFITGAKGLYYNRNRFYSPILCRFTTRDPNETALPIITAMASNATNFDTIAGDFDGRALFGDGMNLHVYLDSNPINGNDPLGLFDDFDEAIVSYTLDKIGAAATLLQARSQIRDGVRKAQLYAHIAFGWMDFVWDQNEAVMLDLVLGPFFASTCFIEGTLVAMADGSELAINAIRIGDEVVCYEEADKGGAPVTGLVTAVYSRENCELLELEFVGAGSCSTIKCTSEHPFFLADLRQYMAARDLPMFSYIQTLDHTETQLVARRSIVDCVTVYNLEVSPGHNYYVSESNRGPWLLVHNGCKIDQRVIRVIKSLPSTAKLSAKQILELSKNLYNVLRRSLPALVNKHGVKDGLSAVRKLLKDPRFRFLDQVPGANEAIKQIFNLLGENYP